MPVVDGISITSVDPAAPTSIYSGTAKQTVVLVNDSASAGTVHIVINGVDTGTQIPVGGVCPIKGAQFGGITTIAAYCASGKSATIYPQYVA